MEDVRLRGLEHGKILRNENENDLIPCEAIIDFSSGGNWQPWRAVIPTKNINAEGEVEEVWLDCRIQKRDDINGIIHKVIDPRVPTSTTVEAVAWIVRFKLLASKELPSLYPSSELKVLYRITY